MPTYNKNGKLRIRPEELQPSRRVVIPIWFYLLTVAFLLALLFVASIPA